jgi:O-antigen/teichoic acid export membrane protein
VAEQSSTVTASSVRRRIRTWFSPNSLSRRASLTSLASSLDFAARVVVEFVVNPLLVQGLGTYLYGAWRVLWNLSGYLWATSGRSAQALTRVIAHGQYSLSETEKRAYVGSAVVVWFVFLPFLLVVGGIGVWLAPHLLKTPSQYVWGVRTAAALLTADAIALTLLTIPRSVLQGENLGYKRMGLSAVMVLLGGGFMALAIYLDTGVGGVALAHLAGTVVTGLLFWRVAKKYVPWFGLARPARRGVRWFLGLSGWFMGWKLVFELMTAGDVLALGLFSSVELVTVYTLTKFVAQSLVPLVGILFEGTSPGLGAIIGSGDISRGMRLRSELMSLTWLVCTMLGASLLLWNRSFVTLWVGQRFYAGALPMLLIVVMVMQFVFVGNDARIIDVTLKIRAKVIVGAISAVLSIALAAILLRTPGNEIVRMCIGIIIGRLILTVAYPWLLGRMLGHPLIAQLKGLPRPTLTTLILFGLAVWLGERVTAESWITPVSLSGTTALVVTCVAIVVGMSARQRRALLKRMRKVVRGSGGDEDGPRSAPMGGSIA